MSGCLTVIMSRWVQLSSSIEWPWYNIEIMKNHIPGAVNSCRMSSTVQHRRAGCNKLAAIVHLRDKETEDQAGSWNWEKKNQGLGISDCLHSFMGKCQIWRMTSVLCGSRVMWSTHVLHVAFTYTVLSVQRAYINHSFRENYVRSRASCVLLVCFV